MDESRRRLRPGVAKYRPFPPVDLAVRHWPANRLAKAPTWCSVDLRDGNQALVVPMNLEEKLRLFATLAGMGFREIEVGFPSASETEFEITRALIERNLIPEGVAIQVLVQAREHLIRRTFEAIRGARDVIVHFYNSTSALQRKVVFHKEMDGIVEIAVEGARLIRELSREMEEEGVRIRYEYSPESFSGTESPFAVEIAARVMETLGATPDRPVILNLPSTVQLSTPNIFADQVEYVHRHLPNRASAILSVHPHNDRGTGVADAELAMLAGAERVEGTLFGNGERTGNVDLVTLGLNLYSQGIEPGLDFSRLPDVREVYEACTGMRVPERQPYAGELVFTAFSGSHQDAIRKGFEYMKESGSEFWEVPYLPIDPADIGRQYEPIIRINSQSGKGGAAFVLQQSYGFMLPKGMHPEFGRIVKAEADRTGRELDAAAIHALFQQEYLEAREPYALVSHHIEETGVNGNSVVRFSGSLRRGAALLEIRGDGNGPIDAFFSALRKIGEDRFAFLSYHEHAISEGSDAKAVAYIELKAPNGHPVFGVGIESNINIASIKGVLSAVNRGLRST